MCPATAVRAGSLLLALSAAFPSAAQAPQAEASVRQGDVARWSGEDAQECGFLGKRYPAVAGTCFYPTDMTANTGVHEAALYTADGRQLLGQLTVTERECVDMDVEVPEEFVELSEENRERHAEERARLLEALSTRSGEPRFELPLQPPTDPMPRGDDDFCANRRFNEGERNSRHVGRDYEIGQGTDLAAPADGTVLVAEQMFMTGGTVIIDHGAGLLSEFFHLGEIAVEPGEEVERGAPIGSIGSTGRSTGPHLHLGARWLDQRIDPAQLLADPGDLADLGGDGSADVAEGGSRQDDADLAGAGDDADADAQAEAEDGQAGTDQD